MKRTPMKRTSGLRPYSARRRRRDAGYPEQRRQLHAAVQGLCEVCHVYQPLDVGHAHHREGRNVADPHRLENLAWLCEADHSRTHLEPLWAYERGLSVRKNRRAA
jgi:hypothetical protein